MKTTINLRKNQGFALGIVLSVLVIFGSGFTNKSQAAQAVDPMNIAKALDIPGKFHAGSCQSFSDELFRRLDAAGVEAYKVTFNWESYKFTAKTRIGTHMFVVFKDNRGRYYGIDNMARRALWLQGNSPGEWTEFFAGMDMGTGVSGYIASSAVRGMGNRALASN